MKKLVKKQMGGSNAKKTKVSAESMKPNAKQPKFDASKVSTNGAKIKGAVKIGSGTYQPDSTTYKKKGGATGAFDKYKAKKK